MEKTREQEIAEIEASLAGLSPAEALKKMEETTRAKPPVQQPAPESESKAGPQKPVEEKREEETAPDADEEEKRIAEVRAQERENHYKNLEGELSRYKEELKKLKRDHLEKTRPEVLDRIDGLEGAVEHVLQKKELSSAPKEQAQPAPDDRMTAFQQVVGYIHPDAGEYMKREDVAKRLAPFFETVGETWIEKPLDLAKEITKLKLEDATLESKKELEQFKLQVEEERKKASASRDLSAMDAPSGGRGKQVSPASADDEIERINKMTPAEFRVYTERVMAGK